MASAGKVIWGVAKWLVIPAGLAYVGYAYYGPQIGKQPPAQLAKLQEQVVGSEGKANGIPTETAEGLERPKYPAPDLEVSVIAREGRQVNPMKEIPGVVPEGDNVEKYAPREENEPEPAGSESNL